MKRFLSKFKTMSRRNKIQLALALLFTGLFVASFPTYAWFYHQRQIAELQKVKTPDLLYISAAYAEDVKYFTIPAINVSSADNPAHKQMFPFAVAGEYVPQFTLQLAHTTNIPFTYTIYEADAYTSKSAAETAIAEKNASEGLTGDNALTFANDAIEYTVKAQWTMLNYTFEQRTISEGQILYFVKGNAVSGAAPNSVIGNDGRETASNLYHSETYDTYSNVQTYAEPVYWQSDSIQSVPSTNASWLNKPFFKTFILEISWDPTKVQNDKETDLVYIAAFRGGN